VTSQKKKIERETERERERGISHRTNGRERNGLPFPAITTSIYILVISTVNIYH